MRCLLVVVYTVVLVNLWPKAKASKTCKYFNECTGRYKNCCDRKCDYRRFCNNYCSQRSDCGSNQYCVNNDCTNDKPSNYCDSDTLCQAKHHCDNNRCVPYCHCGVNEECVDGSCVNPTKSIFTPAAFAGIVIAALILGCICCDLIYKYCRGCSAARANRQAAQQQQLQQQIAFLRQEANLGTQQQQQQLSSLRLEAYLRDTEATEGATNQPAHPGGPPPYHSLGRSNEEVREEEIPAPPSYEEALRNSHNKNV